MWPSPVGCLWYCSVLYPPLGGNSLYCTALCVFPNYEDIVFRLGNVRLVPGFSDIYLILIRLPIAVAVVITSILGLNQLSVNDVYGLPIFEVIWLLVPVIIFVGCGFISLVLGFLNTSFNVRDIVVYLGSNQWHWSGSIISSITLYLIPDIFIAIVCRSSGDVIHSFDLLEFGVHTDCMPGKVARHVVVTTERIDEYVTCQELCGYRHSRISLILEV